jgi:protein arginine N-methyltransferase 7
MQAVYYLPTDIAISAKGQQLEIVGYHDEYSLWFGLTSDAPLASPLPRPFCNCSVHSAVSRTRLGQLNDVKRNSIFVRALEKVVNKDSVCLTLGDCCLLALILAKLGASKVFAIERNPHCRRLLESWIKTNLLEDRVIVLDDGDIDKYQLDKKVRTRRVPTKLHQRYNFKV